MAIHKFAFTAKDVDIDETGSFNAVSHDPFEWSLELDINADSATPRVILPEAITVYFGKAKTPRTMSASLADGYDMDTWNCPLMVSSLIVTSKTEVQVVFNADSW